MDYSPYGPGYNAAADEEIPTGKYAPIGAWGYLGYQILFALPVIGFIFLLIFTFAGGNINRRSFARSYWCGLLLSLVIVAASAALLLVTGTYAQLVEFIRSQLPVIQ